MSVRKTIPEYSGIYFITFTCRNWIKLFEIANAYSLVYDWFDLLKGKGHFILGYVIMPNHLHSLIAFRNTQFKSINTIVGNGKRFIAYGMVKRLRQQSNNEILNRLESFVKPSDNSSAQFYLLGEQGIYNITSYSLIEDVDITKPLLDGFWHLIRVAPTAESRKPETLRRRSLRNIA